MSGLQMQQQNKQLAQHTTSLAAAKQHLEQQLSNLQAAKAELDKQVAALTAQQGGLLQHNQQLADKLAALHGSQQQLQLVADRLHAQVEDANSKLEQQQQKDNKGTKETGGDGGDKLASAAVSGSTVLPVASSGVAPRPGDLSVQVSTDCAGLYVASGPLVGNHIPRTWSGVSPCLLVHRWGAGSLAHPDTDTDTAAAAAWKAGRRSQ